MPEEAQGGPRQGGKHQRPCRPVGELGGDEEEAHGADEGDPPGEAVQAVHEVEGIGDAHDPKPGEEESQGGVQGGAEGGLKPHPHGHEEEGGKRLDEEAEEGRKAELVVNEAHKHEPGSPRRMARTWMSTCSTRMGRRKAATTRASTTPA